MWVDWNLKTVNTLQTVIEIKKLKPTFIYWLLKGQFVIICICLYYLYLSMLQEIVPKTQQFTLYLRHRFLFHDGVSVLVCLLSCRCVIMILGQTSQKWWNECIQSEMIRLGFTFRFTIFSSGRVSRHSDLDVVRISTFTFYSLHTRRQPTVY